MSRYNKKNRNVDEFDILENKKNRSSKKDLKLDESSESNFTNTDEENNVDSFELEKLKKAYKKYKILLKKNKESERSLEINNSKSKKKSSKKSKSIDTKNTILDNKIIENNFNILYSYFNDQIINNVINYFNIINVTKLYSNNISIVISNNTYNDGDILLFYFYGAKTDKIYFYTKYELNGNDTIDNSKDPYKYCIDYVNQLKLILIKNTWFIIN